LTEKKIIIFFFKSKKKKKQKKSKTKTTKQHVSLKTVVDEKSLKLPKKLSEIVNRGQTDNTMAKGKGR
jgi:hypothetical protein